MSLDAALRSLRLFIVDYSILGKADVDSERAVSFNGLVQVSSSINDRWSLLDLQEEQLGTGRVIRMNKLV
jgi:hypothetical protein